jgi:hypothetical protein
MAFLAWGISLLMIHTLAYLFEFSEWISQNILWPMTIFIMPIMFGTLFLLLCIIVFRVTFKKWIIFLQKLYIVAWIVGTMLYMSIWQTSRGFISDLSTIIYFITGMIPYIFSYRLYALKIFKSLVESRDIDPGLLQIRLLGILSPQFLKNYVFYAKLNLPNHMQYLNLKDKFFASVGIFILTLLVISVSIFI